MRGLARALSSLAFALAVSVALAQPAKSQEARREWDRLCQIRQDKLDRILPEAMRENDIDMWIVAMREGHDDPMSEVLGQGYTGSGGLSYYIFTDQGGGRIERTTAGISEGMLHQCDLRYSMIKRSELHDFVAKRNPKRVAIDMSDQIGTADGLSHTAYLGLVKALGDYAGRLVSAEKLISDFRSRHVTMEIVVYSEAGEYSRSLAERALSNEDIIPDKTTLRDVAWWLANQQRNLSLGTSFGMPSVTVENSSSSELHLSDDYVIRRGDLLSIDWGVGYLDAWTDMKRTAYVLKPGESTFPAGIGRAFDKAVAIRDVIYKTVKPGATGGATLDLLNRTVAAMPGYAPTEFGKGASDPQVTGFIIGSHSTGDWGHGSGPWIGPVAQGFDNRLRLSQPIKATNFFSIEFFTNTVIPEWGGKRITIPLEDDAVVTERGVEWIYPPNSHILLIK